MLTKTSRYTNTLMVSLNNRIYFRDHRTPGVQVDNDHIVESDQFRLSAMAPYRFSQVGPSAHSTSIGDSFKLNTLSHTIDLEKKGKGDTVSISSDPRC